MRVLAFVLLFVQAIAGLGVAWAHAAEPISTKVAFESHHQSNCLVVHDELRCTICQFAGGQHAPAKRQVVAFFTDQQFTASSDRIAALLGADGHLPAPARAPPIPLA
jgi:hypothetical protein